MRLSLFAISCLMVTLAQGTASAQELPSDTSTNSILQERLRNAQVTKKTLSNGSVITEVKFTGSLQPNFDLGCIPISEVSSQFNPPALIYAAKKCIQQEQYVQAWALLTTGNGFAYYDLKRLADLSTQGAKTVLTMNVFADLSNAQRERTSKVSKEIQMDPQQVNAYCAELTRIGPPTYEPQWAILHGIGAFQEPRNGPYLTNVDAKSLWEEVLKNRCTPQKLQLTPAPTPQGSMNEFEIPAPVWVVGQWWRMRITNLLQQSPRIFLHRVVEVRGDGYVVQITNETAGTAAVTFLFSKETNFISNAVEGYPVPSMVNEERPDNGRLEFPLKTGSKWERSHTLSNNGDAGRPTLVRGYVSRTVDRDTAFGRKKTFEINIRSQSEGAVAYQGICMYLPDIGRCLEYREGLQTAIVFEAGIEK